MRNELLRRDFSVGQNIIGSRTQMAVLNAFVFEEAAVKAMRHSKCCVVHRVDGPVSVYRREADTSIDRLTAELNRKYADITVFQSHYSLEAYEKMGLDFVSPVIIMNAVDSEIFYPSKRKFSQGSKIRLVATSWSDNPNKGVETYKWLDRNLDWGRLEFTFIGRINCEFRNIKKVPPLPSLELADALREHDIYVTASIKDPCSNALIEGLGCGLPAICTNSGGHPEIVGEAGFCFDKKEEIPEMIDQLAGEYQIRQQKIHIPAITEVTDRYLAVGGIT
jgi:glycosyltransferase involved in cell wall biosynthesis